MMCDQVKMTISQLIPLAVIILMQLAIVSGHGRLIDPPARSTAWRFGFKAPIDYNDHQLFCGGFSAQWKGAGGKCGICGDPYNGERKHEYPNGQFAKNPVIVREYSAGSVIRAQVQLTANHLGYFQFKICPATSRTSEVKQSCLDSHLLQVVHSADPNRYLINHSRTGTFTISLRLPEELTCDRCVFQWTYTSGNNWGQCESGKFKRGCGAQETFRGCADVRISGENSRYKGSNSGHSNSNVIFAKRTTYIPSMRPQVFTSPSVNQGNSQDGAGSESVITTKKWWYDLSELKTDEYNTAVNKRVENNRLKFNGGVRRKSSDVIFQQTTTDRPKSKLPLIGIRANGWSRPLSNGTFAPISSSVYKSSEDFHRVSKKPKYHKVALSQNPNLSRLIPARNLSSSGWNWNVFGEHELDRVNFTHVGYVGTTNHDTGKENTVTSLPVIVNFSDNKVSRSLGSVTNKIGKPTTTTTTSEPPHATIDSADYSDDDNGGDYNGGSNDDNDDNTNNNYRDKGTGSGQSDDDYSTDTGANSYDYSGYYNGSEGNTSANDEEYNSNGGNDYSKDNSESIRENDNHSYNSNGDHGSDQYKTNGNRNLPNVSYSHRDNDKDNFRDKERKPLSVHVKYENSGLHCFGTKAAQVYGETINEWCRINCNAGFCPPSHCTCA